MSYLVTVLVPLFTLALALVEAPSAWASGCSGGGIQQAFYSARFRMNPTAKPFTIKIGTLDKTRRSRQVVAQISMMQNGREECIAVCQTHDLERRRLGLDQLPVALNLSCTDPQWGYLNTPVTILWKDAALGIDRPTIRLGTWITGFRQTGLVVDLDRYTILHAREPSGPHGG